MNEGLFNVLIGSGTITPGTETALADVFQKHADVWLGVEVNEDGEMIPRSRIGSVPFASKADDGVPRGAIIMWSGTLATIPSGWQLCDGTNGTPYLADRFILATAPLEDPGLTGGDEFIQLEVSNLPSHTHHYETNPLGRGHIHSLMDKHYRVDNATFWIRGAVPTSLTFADHMVNESDATHENGGHSHVGDTWATGDGSPVSYTPMYYKLAFIMKM